MKEQQNSMGEVIAKALQDEEFKQKLIADSVAVFNAEWDELSEEARETLLAKLLASALKEQRKLSDDQLSSVSGGIEVVVVEDWTMDQLYQELERRKNEGIPLYGGF